MSPSFVTPAGTSARSRFLPSRVWIVRVGIAVGVIAALILVAWLAVPPIARSQLESRLSQAVVAKGKWANLQQHLQGLHEKQKVAQATLFDVSAAQLQTLQAESDAVSALVAWKIAQVKLKKAQGALAQ